jgi:predicted nucleotidyltransferase
MLIADQLSPALRQELPRSHAILASSGLSVHDAVRAVVLSGSRGPRGGYRPDSDIDLSLLVDARALLRAADHGALLREVVEHAIASWRSEVTLDTAAVFDGSDCGLRCFWWREHRPGACPSEAPDCFGVFKTRKGFDGFVPPIGLQVEKVCPMLVVWERTPAATGALG